MLVDSWGCFLPSLHLLRLMTGERVGCGGGLLRGGLAFDLRFSGGSVSGCELGRRSRP